MFNKLLKFYLMFFPLRFMRYHLFRIEQFIKRLSLEINNPGIKVLDIGSSESPYKEYFSRAEYYSQDIIQNSKNSIHYIGDLNEGIPQIESSYFDYVICTQVLEHIKKPYFAFNEFYRILKPGGKLYLTTHQAFEEHMVPNDYFRFTRYGLRYLGESNGFKVIDISPHGGIFHVIAMIISTLPIRIFFSNRESFFYYLYLILFSIPILIFNMICYLLDFLDSKKNDNYL